MKKLLALVLLSSSSLLLPLSTPSSLVAAQRATTTAYDGGSATTRYDDVDVSEYENFEEIEEDYSSSLYSSSDDDDDSNDQLEQLRPLAYLGRGLQDLGMCEGDCDSDSQCAGNLKCYLRSDFDDDVVQQADEHDTRPPPGCAGAMRHKVDYCYDPDFGAVAADQEDESEEEDEEEQLEAPVAVDDAQISVERRRHRQLVDLTLYGTELGTNLEECRGACLSDDDCLAGLQCYERVGFEAVPGCTGTGIENQGYWYVQVPVVAL